MKTMPIFCLRIVLFLALPGLITPAVTAAADFPAEEFRQRRGEVMARIGNNAIAVIQGAASERGFAVFRQSNQFYYLTGVETYHCYLLIDGRSRRSALYLPHRDEGRERGEGRILSAEDVEEVKQLSGVDAVYGYEMLAKHLRGRLIRAPFPRLYTPHSPAEGAAASRDEILTGIATAASDPWDDASSRESRFISRVRQLFPQFALADLSPILDSLRIVKSPREINLIRRASQIAGHGLMEAMRSTEPGITEYQLDAAARYVFLVNGARREGYPSITAGGTNAWMGHYFRNTDTLKAGDMVLMDYAPDYRYYTSDVARMWPVSGTFSAEQRELYGFILAYYRTLLRLIRPGVTAGQVMDEAAAEMRQVFSSYPFSKPAYRAAAEATLTFRGHLSHPVGLTVHDVGNYKAGPLQPGIVFSIDPMLWVPEEKLYVRIEDVVAVTQDGVENFTDFVPTDPDSIEALMRDRGVVQKVSPRF